MYATEPALPLRAAGRRRGSVRRPDGALAAGHTALVRAIGGAGGELYVWTVDEQPRSGARGDLVTGVITDDPRLFAAG